MASGINSNFLFPGFSPIRSVGAGPFQAPINQVAGPGSGALGQAMLANDQLGDAWHGAAAGGGENTGAQLSQMMQNFGGGGDAGLDPEAKELLKKRPDITAKDLQEMKGEIKVGFKSPAMADAAYKKGLEALGDGGNSAKPQEIGKLMTKMASATGKGGGAAALDMFDTGRELMKNGRTPDELGHLTEGAQKIGGGDGPNNIAQSFKTAADAVKSRPDMKSGDIKQMADVVSHHFPGKDPTERMQAFENGAQMMGSSPNMNAKGIDNMLSRGAEQGMRGPKLLKSFQTQSQAMKDGAINANDLQDKNNKSLSFDKHGNLQREKTSMQSAPNQKMGQLGKEQSHEGPGQAPRAGQQAPAGPGHGPQGGAPGAGGAAPRH